MPAVSGTNVARIGLDIHYGRAVARAANVKRRPMNRATSLTLIILRSAAVGAIIALGAWVLGGVVFDWLKSFWS